ncbi:MAG: ATPase [Hyphococcus sp.]|nr:MAG: ATPase [Marinicaulis sp.]
MSKPHKVKRFYKTVSVQPEGDGFAVCLDGRTVRTQRHVPLLAPIRQLAEEIVKEWEAQNEHIDRESMKLTALLSGALDGVENGDTGQWTEDTLKYLQSDLLCYRADEPAGLVKRQAEIWQPYLDWLQDEFDAPLIVTQTLLAKAQPSKSVDAVESQLKVMSPSVLFAVKVATAITGSAVLALAAWKGAFPIVDIFNASQVDEHFQQERWGVDDEARLREDAMRAEFLKVAEFFQLLKS